MSTPPKLTIDHFTINVSDLDRATRFYRDALGFEFVQENTVGNEAAQTNRIAGDFRVHSRYFDGGGIRLILNWREIPAEPLPPARQQLGLANFAVHVESLEQGMVRVEACGGEVMLDTRTTFPLGEGQRAEVVVCTDPDGQWIELIELQRV